MKWQLDGTFDEPPGAKPNSGAGPSDRKSSRPRKSSASQERQSARPPRIPVRARKVAASAEQAVILIWGLTDQGKTALLWALGERLSGASVGGYSFGNKGDQFQAHWQKLNISLTETGWEQTQAHVSRIEGEELNLFTVTRPTARPWRSRFRVELVSMDIPGEHIQTLQGYQANNNADEELLKQLRSLQQRACAGFVVVRADELHKPAIRRKASEYIRQSLSLLRDGSEGFRLAIVLTACDAIPDAEVRAQLGFGTEPASSGITRSHAAQKYLESLDPVLAEFFLEYPEIRCFATSAWGTDKGEDKKVHDPRPKWVEDPVLWVLDEEFPKREKQIRRSFRAKASFAIMSCSVAIAIWLYTTASGLIPNANRSIWNLLPRRPLVVMPTAALTAGGDVVKSMLHDLAVRFAAVGEVEQAEEALTRLEALDPAGYFYSRARLEVCRLEGERVRVPEGEGADSSWREAQATLLRRQFDTFAPELDRYGKTIIKLRVTTAIARLSSGPTSQETVEVLDALDRDPAFALQYGADIYRDLWAGWLDYGLQRSQLEAALDVIGRAGRQLTQTQYVYAASSVMEPLSKYVLQELQESRNGPLIQASRWLSGQPRELEDAFASHFLGGLAALAQASTVTSSLEQSLAAAYITDVSLHRYSKALCERVWNAVVQQSNIEVANRFLDVSSALEKERPTPLVKAEWRALSNRSGVQAESQGGVEAWADEVISSFSAQEKPIFESVDRFRFLSEVFEARKPEFAAQMKNERARVAEAVITDRFQDTGLAPTQLRGLLAWITSADDAVIRASMANLTKVAVDNTVGETRGREELIRTLVDYYETHTQNLEQGVDFEQARDRLAKARRQVIDLTLADRSSANAAVFEKLVAIRGFAETRADDLERLDSRIKAVAQQLLLSDRWTPACSDAFAEWLNQNETPALGFREFEESGELRGMLSGRISEAIEQRDVRLASWLMNAMAAVSLNYLASGLNGILDRKSNTSQFVEHASTYERILSAEYMSEDAFQVLSREVWEFFDEWLLKVDLETADVSVPPVHGFVRATAERSGGSSRGRTCIVLLRGLELRAFARAVGQGQIDAASDWLLAIRELGDPSESEIRSSIFWGRSAADEVVKTLLEMRARVGPAEQEAVDLLVAATFGTLARIESVDGLLDSLMRWRRLELKAHPNAADLTRELQSRLLERARAADWNGMSSCCKCLSILEAMGWSSSQGVSIDSRSLAEVIGGNFALFEKQGWAAEAARVLMADEDFTATVKSGLAALADEVMQSTVKRWAVNGVVDRSPEFSRKEVRTLISVLASAVGSSSGRSWEAAWIGTCASVDTLLHGDRSDLRFWALSCDERVLPESAREFALQMEGRTDLGTFLALVAVCGDDVCARMYEASLRACADRQAVDSWRDLGKAVSLISSLRFTAPEIRASLSTWISANIERVAEGQPLVWNSETARSSARSTLRDFDDCVAVLESRTLRDLLSGSAQSAWQESAARALSRLPPRFAIGSVIPQPKSRLVRAYIEASGMRALEAEARELVAKGLWEEAWSVAEGLGDPLRRDLWLAELKKIRGMIPVRLRDALIFVSQSEVSVAEYDRFLALARRDPDRLASLASELGLMKITLRDLEPGVTKAELRQSNMPVHKISWIGAAAYAASIGHELPTREIMLEIWGQEKYPWGPEWDARASNTSEGDGSVFAEVLLASSTTYAGPHLASPKTFRGIHGNVAEYLSETTSGLAVSVFGASLFSTGERVGRSNCLDVDASKDARSKARTGVGMRTIARSILLEGK